MLWNSDRCLVAVAGANPDHAVDRGDPDLAVTDPAGLRGLHDDPGDVLDVTVVDDDLDPDLRHQGDVVLSPPVDLGVTLLPAVPADLADGHAGHAEGLQGLADLFPLVRLDHRGHELHACAPSLERELVRSPVLTPPELVARSDRKSTRL